MLEGAALGRGRLGVGLGGAQLACEDVQPSVHDRQRGLCGFGRQNPELERPSPWLRWIDFKGVLSNLGEVDPPLVVFRRAAPLAPCAAVDPVAGS